MNHSPEMLKLYNEVFPNGAERIFCEQQREASHNYLMEQQKLSAKLKVKERALTFFFILSLVFIAFDTLLIFKGHEVTGAFLGTAYLVALTLLFLSNKVTR